MQKKIYGKKFSRNRKSRKALFRALIRSLFAHGKIVTTEVKAKAIRRDIDKLVKLAKTGDLTSVRKINSMLANDRQVLEDLMLKVRSSFKTRKAGFTRLVNLPRRKGDSAKMVRLEWSELGEMSKDSKKVGKKGSVKKVDDKKTDADKKKTLKERLAEIGKKKGSKKS